MSQSLILMKNSASSFCCLALTLLAGVVTLAAPARAQNVGQTLTLAPGWNAVWLEVEPVDANGQAKAPEDVFNNPSIQTVATPKPLSGLSEFFASDPGTITTFNQDAWQQWKRNDPSGLNNLALISGNRPYLVQVAAGPPVVLSLSGKARFYRPTWTPDRYNLVGFGLQGTPTFDAFFGPSGTKHPVGKIFTLNAATGNWDHVTGSTQMVSGQAYWVFCSGQSNYMGPVAVEFDLATVGKLDFAGPLDTVVVGTGVDALELDLEELVFSNAGTAATTPELDLITPDAGAGSLALYVVNPAANVLGYGRGNQVDSAAGAGASAALGKTVASMQTGILTLGAKRNWNDNLPRTNIYRLKTGVNGASFWLPVSAVRGEVVVPTSGTPASEVTGLWVGEVVFDAATSIVEDGAPVRPSAGSAPMRILLHSDGSGTVRLLSQVTVMQTKTAGPELLSAPVLVVDPAKIPFFEGVKERHGKRVGLRIESVAYDMPRKLDGVSQGNLIEDPKFLKLTTLSPTLQAALSEDPLNRTLAQKNLIASSSTAIAAAKLTIPGLLPNYLLSSTGRPPKLVEAYDLTSSMSGAVGAGQTVAGSLILDPFHRSNPFRHAFHHDLAKGPQITRSLSVTFDTDQPVSGRLRGTCTETINGLIKSNLTLTGRVELSRVSTVDTLN
jgi:hypothetical protein